MKQRIKTAPDAPYVTRNITDNFSQAPLRNALYVDSAYPGVVHTGSILQPYTTIQNAIDAVPDLEQWTIIISSGQTFTENLVIPDIDGLQIEIMCEGLDQGGIIVGNIDWDPNDAFLGLTNIHVTGNVNGTATGPESTFITENTTILGQVAFTGSQVHCYFSGPFPQALGTGFSFTSIGPTGNALDTTGNVFSNGMRFLGDIQCLNGYFENSRLESEQIQLDSTILQFKDCTFSGLIGVTFNAAIGTIELDGYSYSRWNTVGPPSITNGNLSIINKATIIDIFTNPGNNNWTHREGLVGVSYDMMSGGSGGGSGAKGPTANNRTGGQGGGSGSRSFGELSASILTAAVNTTQVLVVGAGGAGGAAQTANGTDGIIGTAGNDSSFNGILARGGVPGAGGLQSGTVTVPTTVTINGITGISNARGDISGVQGAAGTSGAGSGIGQGVAFTCPGGGGGGLTITTNAVANGGIGSSPNKAALVGGAAGTTGAGQNGGNGLDGLLDAISSGTGGGGGASNATGNAGNGGNGGLYGSGGGGGGAALDAVGNSGSGGNGAQGIAIITSHF